MSADFPSRRDFVATSGTALGGAWLARLTPLLAAAQACASETRSPEEGLVVLTAREGADFEALAARIVPTDETPGAREANVLGFADRALETFLSDFLEPLREGLARLHERAAASGASAGFAGLSEAEQDRLVEATEVDDPVFFFFARVTVMLGLLTNPELGGNQDRIGWQLIGFEDRYVYQPPFGYYDRDEHGSTRQGEE